MYVDKRRVGMITDEPLNCDPLIPSYAARDNRPAHPLRGMSGVREVDTVLAGVICILAGILIAVYPPLLSIIVAGVLILTGSILLAVGYYHRKLRRHFDNPAVEVFFGY